MDQQSSDTLWLEPSILQAQEGDNDAFAKIYDHFFDAVYRYTAFRLPPEVAEDITADIFVKAWEKLHTYKIRKNVPFAAWLFRIARHTVIDAYRSHKQFEEIPEHIADTDTMNSADHSLRQKEVLYAVRDALENLPKRYREILILSFVSDLSHSDIAGILRMSEGSVRILKMRALRKLEGLLPEGISV